MAITTELQVELTVGDMARIRTTDNFDAWRYVSKGAGYFLKFTKEGSITLEFHEAKNEWEFEVTDTGIGIAKEDFDIIFKDFKRIKSNFVDATPGTGLGLALTKRIVELHGGRIDFNSILGKGSSFSFTIPKDPLDLSQFDEVEKFLRRL